MVSPGYWLAGRTVKAKGAGPANVLEVHLLDLQEPGISEGGELSSSAAGKLLARTILAEKTGVADVRLTKSESGRPVLLGESADRCCFNVSHDGRVVMVSHHRQGCGVDVEDCEPRLLAEVATRFCAPQEIVQSAGEPRLRGLWAAKESVAKALGLGLRVRLSSVTFAGDPARDWAPAIRGGTPTGLLTRVTGYPARHVAVSVRVRTSPQVRTTLWRTIRTHHGPGLRRAQVSRLRGAPWLPAGLRLPSPLHFDRPSMR